MARVTLSKRPSWVSVFQLDSHTAELTRNQTFHITAASFAVRAKQYKLWVLHAS